VLPFESRDGTRETDARPTLDRLPREIYLEQDGEEARGEGEEEEGVGRGPARRCCGRRRARRV